MDKCIVFVKFAPKDSEQVENGLHSGHIELAFGDYFVQAQYSDESEHYITSVALSFDNDDVPGIKNIINELKNFCEDHNLTVKAKLCDEKSNSEWVSCVQSDGSKAYCRALIMNFKDIIIEKEDEPMPKSLVLGFYAMIFTLLVAAPYVGYLERSKADNHDEIKEMVLEAKSDVNVKISIQPLEKPSAVMIEEFTADNASHEIVVKYNNSYEKTAK